jgi:hypothetical protein
MPLEVSVVIPARDEAAAIGACVAALAAQRVGARVLEVIVVAAGEDDTAGAATRAAATAGFGRFEVVPLERGNKNVALRIGCARATAPVVVLLDADTELDPGAVAALAGAVADGPERAVHGAAIPRFDTWISRYWELNRKLVKDLRFDGTLSGEVIALRRATLVAHDLETFFPEHTGAKDDLYLGRALAARGCALAYVPGARATTLVPWTIGGLARTMLRNRRGAMAVVPFGDALKQAALSAALVGGVPAALVAARWSHALAAVCLAPLVLYTGLVASRVAALRRRGLGDHRRELASFLLLDLLGRALKLWAFVERVAGREAPRSFRGGRPGELGTRVASRGAA